MGLSDTYVDHRSKKPYGGRYNKSDGATQGTIGTQPQSVMENPYSWGIDRASGSPLLGLDDKNGVLWLYRYFVTQDIERNECALQDYQYEHTTKGCTPRYGLIFAVKQGLLRAVRRLLRHDSSIDIDAQDNTGNTALHYAADMELMGSDAIYHFLLKKGADSSIKNNAGQTAGEILAL